MRNQKGITLIALIITIIVMLILVAVTISVALNGGIFNNASDAKVKTQRQAEKEELIAKMVGAYDSTGSFATSNVGELPSGAQWCTEDETSYDHAVSNPTSERNWIITKNNNKFYVDSSGSVLDEKPEETNNVTHPNLKAGEVWNNVSLAQNLYLPQLNDYYYISVGSTEIEYDEKLIEPGNEYYPGVYLDVNGNTYWYSWGEYTWEEDNETISITEGWQVSPYSENQDVPNINTIKLSGTVSFTREGDTFSTPSECVSWFIQN